MLRKFALLILPLCLSFPLAAQEEPKRSKETLGLIDQARALPPEFSADILIKLAGSQIIPEKQWKKELLEEAFLTGSHAQLPYPRTAFGGGVEARWNQEYARHGLEALSLQVRAVTAMLGLDGPRGAAMFQSIVFPTLEPEKCSDVAVASLAGYFAAAAQVYDRGFTAKEREKEKDLQFLEMVISRMQSPATVSDTLLMIFTVKPNPDRLKRLLTAFAVTLDRVSGGDRAYAATEWAVVPADRPEVREVAMLLPAIRSYIVRQVSGPRCSDSIKPTRLRLSDGTDVTRPTSVKSFNALAAKVDPGATLLKPITDDEAKPLKDDGTYPPQRVFGSARATQALMALKWLNHGDTNPVRAWTAEERKSQEWNGHFNDLLKLMEGWKESEEDSPEEYLINVSYTYSPLAAEAPPGPARENVMGRFLNFLETRYAETKNRNLWFNQVDTLLRRAQRDNEPGMRAWILEHLARSSNPIIALYSKMESLLGPGMK